MRRQIFCLLSIVCVCALAHAQGPLRLVITSPTATLDQSGSPVQLHAYEAFLRGNGFRADVTNSVVWSSSDSSIASIDSTGLVTPGANLGSVVISARTISGPAASGTITVAVTPPALTSITVLPASATVHAGFNQQFSAMGNYSNGSSHDITAQVQWDSTPSNVATIVSSGTGAGNASGANSGTATITAKDPVTNIAGTATLGVDAAILQFIDVQPKDQGIAAGLFVQFAATGTFSDATTADITSSVTWASDNPAAATISSNGVATAVAVGSSNISATREGIGDSTTLTVTAAQLTSIAVTPANGAIVVGQAQQYTATGTYTDSTTQNITSSVSWSSTNTSAAAIDATGLATAKNIGNTSITATSGSITGSTGLMVNAGSTATALISSANPSVYGQGITLTATVSPVAPAAGTPTGTVTFSDGAMSLGGAALDASGQACLSIASLAVGSHSLTASYSGDGNFNSSASAALAQTVGQGSSFTSLSSSVNPSVSGQSVTLSATVTAVAPASGTPTGSVSFFEGPTNLGSAALDASGQATLSIASLAVGGHSLTASYSGDTNFNSSTSATLAQTVNKGSSSTNLISSIDPSLSGQSITLTATVSAVVPANGTATGSVSFFDGATSLGSTTLNASGQATLSIASLSVGAHTLTASYTGDGNFNASTSATLSQTVNQADSATSLSSSVNPSVVGQSITLTATVTAIPAAAGTPTGTVTFFDGATKIGSGTLDASGQTTLSISSLSVGNHSLTASYSGDANFNVSASAALAQTVGTGLSSVSLTSSINPSGDGQAITLTATVAAVAPATGTPTGLVNFFDGVTNLGTAMLDASGVTTLGIASLAVGNHNLTASYGGDGNFNSNTSATLTQTVNQGSSATSLVSSANPSVVGQSITLTATVSAVAPAAGIPTGAVTFFDGATSLGTATLDASGQAALNIASLSVGSHSLTASFSGDGNFNASNSATLTQTVNQISTSTTISSSLNPSIFGQSVTFTATVTPSSATGTVSFFDGATNIGTGTLTSGQATLTSSALAAGSHAITAQYGGDTNDAGSTSAPLTQTVSAISLVSITVTPDTASNPSVPLGLTQQFTATGSYSDGSSADITSQVTWSSSNNAIATISNNSGTNGLATGAATGGPVTITATFGSVSGTSALTVSNATLLSGTMVVLPSAATIPAGLAQQFTAFGDFSDGNTYDITTTVVWSSSNTGLATISNASGSQGLAAAIAAGGPVTITATYGGGGAGYTATASLTVSNAVLQSIALTPANPSVPKGVTQQFTATGNYSDASTFDLTNLAAWNSATTSVATINSAGLASAVNVGSSSISATYQGITGSTTLTVTSAVLQSITIAANPAVPAAGLPAGITQSFVATGHYSDGSTLTLSGATWTSSNTAIATVNNSGLARTLAAGATNLSASLSGITGAFALTVNNATLSSIAVTPANATLAIGSTLQYTATGTYSNGTSFNITSTVTWSATPGNKVKITSAGVARRLRSGQATIRATSGAVTGTTKVF